MSDQEIFKWVDEFSEIDPRGLDGHRHFVRKAINAWFKKDKYLFIYNLKHSGLTTAQIVHFAMREHIEDVEADFFRDLKLYFDGSDNYSFYNPA